MSNHKMTMLTINNENVSLGHVDDQLIMSVDNQAIGIAAPCPITGDIILVNKVTHQTHRIDTDQLMGEETRDAVLFYKLLNR